MTALPTINIDHVKVNDNKLTQITLNKLRDRFKAHGHEPSQDHWKGLEHIAKTIEFMAAGVLAPNFYVSFLPPGIGKTSTLIEAVKAMTEADYQDRGIIIFLSRLEEINNLVKQMDLPEHEYAVIVSKDRPENDLGNQAKTEARVLFTTQQQLEIRSRRGDAFEQITAFHYKGKPRQVRVWDEAILPSITFTLERYDLSELFKTLVREKKHELKDELEGLFKGLEHTKDGDLVQIPDIDRYGIGLDEAKAWFEKEENKVAVEALWSLSGRTVRVRVDNFGNTALDYDDILPADLAPMLILDASGQQRNTYKLWFKGRKGLEFLHSPQKSYEGFTIHHWDRGAGKKKQTEDSETIIEGVSITINESIPQDEEVLVIHFKQSRYIKDYEKHIRQRIKVNPERVKFCNWGRHTATNDYKHIKHVILAGILQYNTAQYEAAGRGAKGINYKEELSPEEYQETRLGEVKHHILQAACRGAIRNSIKGKCPEGCHLYVIFSSHHRTGIPREVLDEIFPQATVQDWRPVINLSGRVLQLADILVAASKNIETIELDKKWLMEQLGMKHRAQLDVLLKHDDLQAYLEKNWVGLNKKHGKVLLM